VGSQRDRVGRRVLRGEERRKWFHHGVAHHGRHGAAHSDSYDRRGGDPTGAKHEWGWSLRVRPAAEACAVCMGHGGWRRWHAGSRPAGGKVDGCTAVSVGRPKGANSAVSSPSPRSPIKRGQRQRASFYVSLEQLRVARSRSKTRVHHASRACPRWSRARTLCGELKNMTGGEPSGSVKVHRQRSVRARLTLSALSLAIALHPSFINKYAL
jgi:hypothetical protein